MKSFEGFVTPIRIDYEGLIETIQRRGTPDRVYHMELFQDVEIRNAIAERFDVYSDIDVADPRREEKQHIAMQRFCGWPVGSGTIS